MTSRMVFTVRGIVQGVGFRPFVLRQARALGLAGSVLNNAGGVVIAAEGERESCLALLDAITSSPPPGALIFSTERREEKPLGEKSFVILPSEGGAAQAAVSPDLGICADCERELLDPSDRRYRYPFLNCTACGPRFTILKSVPYDRARTTMAKFPMCAPCASEYKDPENRRFHAQPTACPDCGPRLMWLENGQEKPGDGIARFGEAMRGGKLIGIRGLGGYHIACDAMNEEAVLRLRDVKRRYAKPFAIMVRDIAAAREICEVSAEEARELTSVRKPIVLLEKRPDCAIAEAVAPDNKRLGVMLPYTPLHVLLLREAGPIVLTSANISDEPMPYVDEDAVRVGALSDAVLTHNRPILRRMDDSVVMFAQGRRRLIRRARGFVPEPLPMAGATGGDILAFGAQLKNTFCLVKDGRAYISGHMGDLDDAETYDFYARELGSFLSLFGGRPGTLACDLHPDYASTRTAMEWAEALLPAKLLPVQHHHAHFASVLAENGLDNTPSQGFIWDGAGYAQDGSIWGGEQLMGDCAGFTRRAGLRGLPLIGGDAAIREPWRAGLAAVADACGEDEAIGLFGAAQGVQTLLRARKSPVISPCSGGMGRLFDAVAAIAGLYPAVAFEGQAAIALEQAYDESAKGEYAFDVAITPDGVREWDWRPVIRGAVRDIPLGAGVISARFHRALAALAATEAVPGLPVALSGGVFQNVRLLCGVTQALEAKGMRVYANSLVPTNDGGISFGQAAVAAAITGGK